MVREQIGIAAYSDRECERVTEREREREKTSKTRGDYASTIREQRDVSEPIKGKGKGRFAGPIQHCGLMADCTLAPE
jgi:hypothetical protein